MILIPRGETAPSLTELKASLRALVGKIARKLKHETGSV